MENKIYKLTDKEFSDLVKSSLNISEVLFKLGYTTVGNSWGYSQVKQRMQDLNLSGKDFRGKSAIVDCNEKKEIDKNVIVVCKHGYGTSQLIKGGLEYFYRMNDVKVLSYEEFLDYNLDNTQLVVTSLDLKKRNRDIPVIKVNPLLDDDDIRKLDFYLERKVPRKIEVKKIMEIINKYTFVESNPEMLKELAEYCNDINYENNGSVVKLLPENEVAAE